MGNVRFQSFAVIYVIHLNNTVLSAQNGHIHGSAKSVCENEKLPFCLQHEHFVLDKYVKAKNCFTLKQSYIASRNIWNLHEFHGVNNIWSHVGPNLAPNRYT